ncbi:MAG: M23 family metallopeptidase [Acidimicrobiales bacterium]|nr:M23 family metallopeptidase [Acidimicrobiales bacterium]
MNEELPVTAANSEPTTVRRHPSMPPLHSPSRSGHRARSLAVAAVVGAAGLLATTVGPVAQAQSNPILDLFTTTTTAPPTTTTTTTTTAPVAAPADPGPTPAPPGAQDAGGDGAAPPDAGIEVPPEAAKLISAVRRSGPNNSRELVAALGQLTALGADPATAAKLGMGRFPIAGEATYSHDWLFPRYGPGFRFHLGTDIFAAQGTPVRAPVDGIALSHQDPLGGLSVRVVMPDKTAFYLAHLAGLVEGFQDNMPVATGDIVGYVGTSGNARGGSPHLHFGVYPKGLAPVDPKPVLDGFLAEAMAALPAVVEAYRVAHPVVAPAPPVVDQQQLLRPMLATALVHPLASGGDGWDPARLYLLASAPGRNAAQLMRSALADLGRSLVWSP